MKTAFFEFEYLTTNGLSVVVEVEAMLFKGSPNPDSDWEAKDYLEILKVEVFYEGEKVEVEIADAEVLQIIQSKIREAQIHQEFLEEGGGF